METTYSSETSVDFQGNARLYIPEVVVLFITTAVRTSNHTMFILFLSTQHFPSSGLQSTMTCFGTCVPNLQVWYFSYIYSIMYLT
jgi:hypothetical protein